MNYQTMHIGLITAFNFFQRHIYTALIDMRNTTINRREYFKDVVYTDIDDYLPYMFRLFQATQNAMVIGLNKVIDNQVLNSRIYLCLLVILPMIFMIYWLVISQR
jgi:hypothetical protein